MLARALALVRARRVPHARTPALFVAALFTSSRAWVILLERCVSMLLSAVTLCAGLLASLAAAFSSPSRQFGTVGFPSTSTTYPNIPWPLPQHMATGGQTVALAKSLSLSCDSSPGCDPTACAPNGTISKAVSRYAPILSPSRAPVPDTNETVLDKIQVCVGNASEMLGPEMNETHALSVPAVSGQPVHINAASQHGVLRGLESLAHLVSISHPGRITSAPVEITDSPRWGTRGAHPCLLCQLSWATQQKPWPCSMRKSDCSAIDAASRWFSAGV